MKKKFNQGHAGRLETGKKVLRAAGSVDTTPVAERLAGLVEQQTQYAAALQAVDEAQARVTAAGAELGESSLTVDGALDRLIAALVTDGAAYREPLASYVSRAAQTDRVEFGETDREIRVGETG